MTTSCEECGKGLEGDREDGRALCAVCRKDALLGGQRIGSDKADPGAALLSGLPASHKIRPTSRLRVEGEPPRFDPAIQRDDRALTKFRADPGAASQAAWDTGRRLYVCPACGEGFRVRSGLVGHVEGDHPRSPDSA